MFKEFSREQILRVVSVAFMLFTLFGVDLTQYGLTQDSTAEFLVTGALILSVVFDGVGYFVRFTKGDVDTLGRRI